MHWPQIWDLCIYNLQEYVFWSYYVDVQKNPRKVLFL